MSTRLRPIRRPRRTPVLVVAVLALLASACSGAGPGPDGAPAPGVVIPDGPISDVRAFGDAVADEHPLAVDTSGDYVVDLGFRPVPDGFGFHNYGNDEGRVNLTAAEMVELFGDDVCAAGAGPTCRLSSPAVMWLQQVNASMAAGHCDGMASLSLRFFDGSDQPERFGASTTFGLEIDGNEPLQREIARWWATQLVSPANEQRVTDAPPSQLVSMLRDSMSADPDERELYSVLLFLPGYAGGHAVTPFAVEDRGDDVVWILVYDNNHPGVTRAIEVDLVEDTWEYLGSGVPGEPATVYRGDASTATLWLAPQSARVGVQRCQVCGGELDGEIAALGSDELKLTGDGADLVDTDFFVRGPTGRTFGRVGGSIVDELDGAEVVPLLSGARSAPAPVLRVPHLFDVEAVAAGPAGVTTDLTMSYLGAAYDVLVSGIDTAEGAATVGLDADAGRVTFRSGDATGVALLVALEGDGVHHELEVRVDAMDDPSATIELSSPDDDAWVGVSAGSGATWSLTLTRFGEGVDEDRRTVDGLRLDGDEALSISFDDWTGPGPFELGVFDRGVGGPSQLRTVTVG